MVIFLATAWVGYWAAYDKASAWIKVWLIVTAILFYYVLSGQSKRNLEALSLFSFFIGLAISAYFFLTHEFTGGPGNISSWWMSRRPLAGLPAVHHGYISGLLVITTLFSIYWLWSVRQKSPRRYEVIFQIFFIAGLGIELLAFFLTMSRGVWLAAACGLGAWIIWVITGSNLFVSQPRMRTLFPLFILVYLSLVLALAYIGPAQAGGGLDTSPYGSNSRAELFERGVYFLLDFPITGGGLTSFPGLYSQYIIVIPFFYFINSYNMFLDVAIEQGVIGSVTLLLIYGSAIWLVCRTLVSVKSRPIQIFSWLCLFVMIFTVVHGVFYDYLYLGLGVLLLFFPVGISMAGVMESGISRKESIIPPAVSSGLSRSYISVVMLIPVLGLIVVLALNMNKIISIWYSNLGAVQMSQAELKHFPTNHWTEAEMIPQLEKAEVSFQSAIQYNPDNRTANYRLGMISMARQDFESASMYLEMAYQESPSHRGIIKNLGYCYVWLGKMDKAKALFEKIPEAQEELHVYVWWWGTQGRSDLSEKASMMVFRLESSSSQ